MVALLELYPNLPTLSEEQRRRYAYEECTQAITYHFLEVTPTRIFSLALQLLTPYFPTFCYFFSSHLTSSVTYTPIASPPLELRDRVQKLQVKLGMEKPVTLSLYAGLDGEMVSVDRTIIFPQRFFTLPLIEQDFLIAHELVHIHHKHSQMKFYFSLVVVICDIAAIIFCFYTIPLIEWAAFSLEKRLLHSQEWEADKGAIRMLKANKGALDYFRRSIAQLSAAKFTSHSPSQLSDADKLMLFSYQSKIADFPIHTHPNYPARFKHALTLRPT